MDVRGSDDTNEKVQGVHYQEFALVALHEESTLETIGFHGFLGGFAGSAEECRERAQGFLGIIEVLGLEYDSVSVGHDEAFHAVYGEKVIHL